MSTVAQSEFLKALVSQLRATDQFGSWSSMSDEELLTKKYVKTKEDLKNIPVVADIDEMVIGEIRLIYQALSVLIEQKKNRMCGVVMEMSHEGFGRCIVIAENFVLVDKTFRDAHRFGYRTLEKLDEDGQKMLKKAIDTIDRYKDVA